MKKPRSKSKSTKKVGKKSTANKKLLPAKLVRTPGIDKGKIIIKPNFDEPLTEFEG